jgi:hypothetical protein
MNLSLSTERHGRLVATLSDEGVETTVTAAHGHAAGLALLEAIDRAAADGYGECFWQEPNGTYWWMLRRLAMRLELVVLWNSGGVTGWQHVFRAVTHADDFSKSAADLIAAQSVPPAATS